jgi:hypothetical protein
MIKMMSMEKMNRPAFRFLICFIIIAIALIIIGLNACGSKFQKIEEQYIEDLFDSVDVNTQIHKEYYDSLYEAKEDSMAYLEWKIDQQYK